MLVKFLNPIRYAKDGIHLETGFKGQTVELPLDLAKSLIRDKFAEEVKEEIKKDEGKKDALSTESSQSKLAGAEAEEVNIPKKK